MAFFWPKRLSVEILCKRRVRLVYIVVVISAFEFFQSFQQLQPFYLHQLQGLTTQQIFRSEMVSLEEFCV